MSARLLPAGCTAYAASTRPVDELEAAADELGWRCVVLDGSEVEDQATRSSSCAPSRSPCPSGSA